MNYNWIDKTDMRWGKLVAKKYLGKEKWLCQCDCGNQTIVDSNCLRLNPTRHSTHSCGKCTGMGKDIHFFEKIDTEEKAYFLGFLASDGTISNSNDTYSIKLVVSSQDIDVLEKFKKALKTDAVIKTKKLTTHLPQGGICCSEMSSILVCNKKLVEDLISLGVTPQKSYSLDIKIEDIPEHLRKDFLRGLFDGDGSFGLYDRKTKNEQVKWSYVISLTTSRTMADEVKEEVLKIFPNFKVDIWQAKGCSTYTKRWGLSRKQDFKDFLDYLYKDSTIYLDRKYQKYLVCMEKYNSIKKRKPPFTNYK